jgi:hypothetical protein
MKLSILILAAAGALSSNAQTVSAELEIKIPFAFEINGRSTPAGQYVVRHTATSAYATVKHAETGRGFLFDSRRASGIRLLHSNLIFERHANGYVLTQISDKQNGMTLPLPRARSTKESGKVASVQVGMTIAE